MNLFNYTEQEDKLSGIRLHKLEVYNWGTFNKKIWQYHPAGNTSLLTGDSGSGKSTLVDALTTILVQPQKIKYNKAADAAAKERNSKSYVLGYYGKKYAYEGKGTPEALRGPNSYSTILATFRDESQDLVVTLAVFFWFKEKDGDPNKMYVVSQRELSIAEDFSQFNSDVNKLRASLKEKNCEIFDSFRQYGQVFRKYLGNMSEKATDLFQQSISMKKVEALNGFVRENMLEKEDFEPEVDKLLKHYQNLNTSYQAVRKARRQIEMLEPINTNGKKYTNMQLEKGTLIKAQQSLKYWFASKMSVLLEERIIESKENLRQIRVDVLNKENEEQYNQQRVVDTSLAISQNGGDQINNLESQLERKREELTQRGFHLAKYHSLASKLDLKKLTSSNDFNQNRQEIPVLQELFETEKNSIQDELTNLGIEKKENQQKKDEIDKEVVSLQSRTSNIHSRLIELRDELTKAIGVDQEALRFAGELLEVKDSESKWEGAIERLVHSFGLSLLVAEEYYDKVVAWVNQKPLGQRLVYFRVKSGVQPSLTYNNNDQAVYTKLVVKADTYYTEWLKNEIQNRFDHTCTEDLAEFKKHSRAITLMGQIKSNIRFEKDDRTRINDRSKYVLGFSNKRKIMELKEQSLTLKEKIAKNQIAIDKVSSKQKVNQNLLHDVKSLEAYENYYELDVNATELAINKIEKELAGLRESNSLLETLTENLNALKVEGKDIREKLNRLSNLLGKAEDALDNQVAKLQEKKELLVDETKEHRESYGFLANNLKKFSGVASISLENGDRLDREYLSRLASRAESLNDTISSLKSGIERSMQSFRNEYQNETLEMSASVDFLKEYDDLLKRLKYDNLPKYQDDFKQELQGKIIRHIAMFSGYLDHHSNTITNKVNHINKSLHSIDYNPGRYILIKHEKTNEADVQAFRRQLKMSIEGTTSGIEDMAVAERKFNQIKEIIERFKGREGFIEIDKRWTARVCDVRNWFVFSASERWRENDEEYEHYSDSDGKSGGQKEKLAYTILAASLAYNYGLHDASKKKSSFRLVTIDEAFLKSSDESAKFGLQLFKQMNFQLLVVTPLLKISTIEPFISHVGFVNYSEVTHESEMQNLTIEEYKDKRQDWRDRQVETLEQASRH